MRQLAIRHNTWQESCFKCRWSEKTIGSLSKRVFETWTATGKEHFVSQDSDVSQIFILTISNGEKILSYVNVVV